MSKLVDDIRRLEEITSKKTMKPKVITNQLYIKPWVVMTVIAPSRKSIQVYSHQPASNQCNIIKNFMEVENAREAIRTRIQSERKRLD